MAIQVGDYYKLKHQLALTQQKECLKEYYRAPKIN